MVEDRRASQVALIAVLLVIGGSVFWWVRQRPSYLLFQAHSQLGEENQAAVISEYRRLLSNPKLPREEEIRIRMSLGELYIRALQEGTSVSVFRPDGYSVENPFVADAKAEFDRVIALDPHHGLAHYYLGRILWYKNLESYALEEFEISRRASPNNPEPLRYLSIIKRERGDPTSARELALQALALDPQNDAARRALIDAYASAGEFDKALNEFDRLSPAERASPSTRADMALQLARQNHWEQADTEMKEALRLDPYSGAIRTRYGQLLLLEGRLGDASGQLAQASSLSPRDVWPLLWQGQAWAERGECDSANRVSQLLVDGLPRWGWAHLAAAWTHLCSNNDDQAVEELNEALRLSPRLMEALALEAEIFLDREQFDRSGSLVRPLLDERVNQSSAHAWLARSFAQQGRTELGMEMAETAIQLNPRNSDAFLWLAWARAGKGEEAGALRAAQNAVDLKGWDPRTRSFFLYFQRRLNAEKTVFGLATEANNAGRDPWPAYLLGECLREKNRWEEAGQAYQRALTARPYFLLAQVGLISVWDARRKFEERDAAIRAAFQINSTSPVVAKWRKKLDARRS